MCLQVEARNLCKEYSGKKVLVDVSFGVENGEIFALISPNGAGIKIVGGEAQRVELAQALVTELGLLLLDEPTADLDPRNVSIVEEALLWINREHKTTIIMATHNMFQAQNLAHRVAFLLDGKIEKVGTIEKIFDVPSRYLASFARLENVFSPLKHLRFKLFSR